MINSRIPICLLFAGLPFAFGAQGQTTAAPDTKPNVFEVVSIKPHHAEGSGGIPQLPDGEHFEDTTLEILIKGTSGVINDSQVIGMPAWAKSDRYDIETRVDAETAERWRNISSKERWKQQDAMMQAMLAERCKLKVHFKSKTLSVYNLVIAKGGLKMKESTPKEQSSERVSNGSVSGRAIQIRNFIHAIPADGRIIEDKTALGDRKFDFDLKWSPDSRPAEIDSGPSLLTALEEQLGLKLVSAKALEKILVIEHIERPTPN